MLLASVGHVNPILVLRFMTFSKNHALFIYTDFMKKYESSWEVFPPSASTVHFHRWCVIVERDGSDFRLCCACGYVFGFCWACESPYWCSVFFIFEKKTCGSVLPRTSAVDFHGWCASVERDGSDFVFGL